MKVNADIYVKRSGADLQKILGRASAMMKEDSTSIPVPVLFRQTLTST
jgi:hypothetical protein